ncbi:uncharacterized protein [Leptinotarsa decemlineata]|uniref:uncharacterized protein n=1 Tax=Leptinotarsa decemlineata TaxID=7539 RepID=UPI000C2521E5|nr:uncharacterized protein LOC111507828 [Leptinotarsa decemlineata]
MQEERLKLPKPQNYHNNKVLVGNWFEEECSYQKSRFKHTSKYSDDFQRKPYTTYPPSVVWDAHIKAEGHAFYPEKSSEEFPNFHDNFATVYDLSFEYFPKLYSKEIDRVHMSRLQRFDPTEEYLKSYGNISNFGLTDCKKQEWDCDKQDPRSTSLTMYDTEFPSPKTEFYKFSRWTRPTAVKSQFGPVHRPYPANHPRFSKCNPITWECKGDLFQKYL